MIQNSEIENIEFELLLEAIFKRYGHDFRHYAKASLKRRVLQAKKNMGAPLSQT